MILEDFAIVCTRVLHSARLCWLLPYFWFLKYLSHYKKFASSGSEVAANNQDIYAL